MANTILASAYHGVVSLAAATATGAGQAYELNPSGPGFPIHFTWSTVVTGSPTGVNVNLEGTIDGANWFTLDSSTTTTSELRHVVNKPVMYIRCNLSTLTAGTSPTVTCVIFPVVP